jgi:hypothetical protein
VLVPLIHALPETFLGLPRPLFAGISVTLGEAAATVGTGLTGIFFGLPRSTLLITFCVADKLLLAISGTVEP